MLPVNSLFTAKDVRGLRERQPSRQIGTWEDLFAISHTETCLGYYFLVMGVPPVPLVKQQWHRLTIRPSPSVVNPARCRRFRAVRQRQHSVPVVHPHC